jgi:predicted transcriptional regulator
VSIACTIRIDDDMNEELVKLAKANNRNKAFYIKEAIKDYLSDQKEADIALARMKNPNMSTYTTEEMIERLKARKDNV